MPAPSNVNTMQKHRGLTLDRLRLFLQDRQFSDVNLRSALKKQATTDGIQLSVYSVPDLKRIPFKEAIKNKFKPAKVGDVFGPSTFSSLSFIFLFLAIGWSTHWFKVVLTIPHSFRGEEVTFFFDPGCEGLFWTTDGKPIMAITGGGGNEHHVDFLVTKNAKGGEKFEYYIEIACNGLFGMNYGGIDPPPPNRYFALQMAELAVMNKEAQQLFWDVQILIQIVEEISDETQVNGDALFAANAIVTAFKKDDAILSIREGLKISEQFFKTHYKEGKSLHEITAIGNCHIDTAWLWPYGETKRKIGRSWATQTLFMDEFPFYQFTASQAQQFEWCEQLYPEVFSKIKEKVKNGQFVPIGGTWVEMDTNVPSGESICRQFLYGWAESAQLPQILKQADLKYFFTQKMSWNNINKFPHTTFNWAGIDGTEVLTHFSPADTYACQGTVRDINYSVKNNKDKAYTSKSLVLYGNGDGGGGPLIPMIKRLERLQRIEGLPAVVKFESPNDFFVELDKSSPDLVKWKGELYLELHRGTYTSHGIIKRYNRKMEYLLREVELLSTVASNVSKDKSFVYPKAELDRCWKLILLNQFHDVLPGSAIEMVYDDATEYYRDVEKTGLKLRDEAEKVILGELLGRKNGSQGLVVFNSTGWKVPKGVVEVGLEELGTGMRLLGGTTWRQISEEGKAIVIVDDVPAMGFKPFGVGNMPADFGPVSATTTAESIILENSFVTVTLDLSGRVVSFYDKAARREAVAKDQLANVFRLYEDVPLFWDAWDVEIFHLEKGRDAVMGHAKVKETGPVRAVVVAKHQITPTSHITQRIILTAASGILEFDTKIEWNENRQLLKVEFPVDISSDVATYETQFGYVQRPTHFNTSWDFARFEVCGHKFVDLSEFGFGVALLNDCKFGFSTKGNVMRMSLLKSPKAPDEHCDIHTHYLRYALYPHKGSFSESDVVEKAYQFNVPPTVMPALVPDDLSNTKGLVATGGSVFKVDLPNVVIDTVKVAEDPRVPGGKDVVVRLYEAMGGRGRVGLESWFDVREVRRCNVMEDVGEVIEVVGGKRCEVDVGPFEIVSLRLLLK
ncbi:Glycoside hydrolase, 38 vacuolar alpha mannosidase [Phlyctochytrium planicorne]|nr:Glycoside hydrolase, 38 vacuolar alpha mannosidase [Phlyctochytrium planicorne]